MRRATTLAMLCALALIPCAAYAADVQFHLITEKGNVFILAPPDLPRPANIISETAFISVENPPAGMFILTAPNGTTQRVTPLQSGIDTDGFAGGTIRVILKNDWDAASDRTFRDQAFGSASGNPMRHSATMPLAANWNDTYDRVQLLNSSCFGLNTGGCSNNILSVPNAVYDGYSVNMGTRDRIGLDFGPGTGDDRTYYIYRGCGSNCDAKVVVGHGNPLDPQQSLPNDLTIVDHHRGWLSVTSGGCNAAASQTWPDTVPRTISATEAAPGNIYSRAGDYYINSRYADLSILPQSHSNASGTCTVNLHSHNGDDNRKHDMCVTGTTTDADSTHTYTCSEEVEETVDEYYTNNWGHLIFINSTTTTTTSSCSTITRTNSGSCTTPTTSDYGTGYSVSTTCTPGTAPPKPAGSITTTTTQVFNNPGITETTTTTTRTYSDPSTSTDGEVNAFCTLHTNTPYLNLHDAMSLKPGLNVYSPGTLSTGYNILVIYDDAAGPDGGSERIQVFRTDDPGLSPEPAGPYDFHLHRAPAGILYDSHQHYGWVSGRHYDSEELRDMGYTQLVALAGHGDGIYSSGAGPSNGRWLCHGDCFLGPEGINSVKPMIRTVTAASSYTVPPVNSAVYDHVNSRWYELGWAGAMDGTVSAATQYLVVPFAEDVSIRFLNMYDDHFNPAAQLPSARDSPAVPPWCHMRQHGHIASPYPVNHVLNVTDGESLRIPVLPGVRYVAFMGNGDCYWYDVASLPSPLSGVSSGARHVPLVDGTILTGDLTVRGGGLAHIDVSADVTAVWQSEAVGLTTTGLGLPVWFADPLDVTLTAVARVNGAAGACGSAGVHCSQPIRLTADDGYYGFYIHGSGHAHGAPYARTPHMLPPAITGSGVYGLSDGRCYGLAIKDAGTDGITLRSIPRIPVDAGDTIALSFEASYTEPVAFPASVTMSRPAGHVCDIHETMESAVVDVSMMTATLR